MNIEYQINEKYVPMEHQAETVAKYDKRKEIRQIRKPIRYTRK